jgi:hypothetical protein
MLTLMDNEKQRVLFRYELGKRLKVRDSDAMIVMKLIRFGPALWRMVIHDDPYFSTLVGFSSMWKSAIFVWSCCSRRVECNAQVLTDRLALLQEPFVGAKEPADEKAYLVQVYGGLVEKVLTDVRGYQFRVSYDGCIQRTNVYAPPAEDNGEASIGSTENRYTTCTVYVVLLLFCCCSVVVVRSAGSD